MMKKVKEAVKPFDPDVDVILFGSRARGDYREQSDWDFLILTSMKIDWRKKREIHNAIFCVELDTSAAISPLIYSKPEWETQVVTDIYKNIAEEGVQL